MTKVDVTAILAHMSDGFLAVGADGRVTAANLVAETLLQRPSGSLIGSPHGTARISNHV